MNRPSTILGLVVALALPAGCGKESDSATACRDEYVKLYTAAVKLLTDASPGDPDIDKRMTEVLGTEPARACREDPRSANATLEQVAREFAPQFDPLEKKWGRDNLSGFRNPLGAGHGPPVQNGSPSG